MQFQAANISSVTGLTAIFLLAAFQRDGLQWIAGVVALMILFTIRNLLGEISFKTDRIFAILSWCCTGITVMIMIIKY
ncbi:MAG: hypothetical protein ACNA7V_03345 [Bacteroidales bacterium]